MPAIHAKVRKAMYDALADAANGFNATLAARLAAEPLYSGMTAYTIDFGSSSVNFAQSYLLSEDVEDSRLSSFPLMLLYTTSAEDRRLTRFSAFDGVVFGHVDVVIRRDKRTGTASGIEDRNTEVFCDATADAIVDVLTARLPNTSPASMTFNGGLTIEKTPVVLLPDGFEQRVGVVAEFRFSTAR